MAWYRNFDKIPSMDLVWEDQFSKTHLQVQLINEILPKDPLLDLGCGLGRHCLELAKRGRSVIGLDISKKSIEKATAEAKEKSIDAEFVQGDMRMLPFRDSFFMGVYSLFTTFGYFSDLENEEVIREVVRVLCREGLFLVDVTNRDAVIQSFVPKRWRKSSALYVLEEREFDLIRSRINTTFHFLQGGVHSLFFTSVRVYSLGELHSLMKRNGLTFLDAFGDYEKGKYSLNSSRMILVFRARKRC